MNGYAVNIHELAKLIDVLKDGAEQVRDANKTLAAVGQLDMLGNDELKFEAHRLEEKWHYGLDKLDETADAVVDRLEQAKRNYEQLEQSYSSLYDKFGGNGGQPGIADRLGGGS